MIKTEEKIYKNRRFFLVFVILLLVLCIGRELGHTYTSEGYIENCTWVEQNGKNVLNEVSLGLNEGEYMFTFLYDAEDNSTPEIQFLDMQHCDAENQKGVSIESEILSDNDGEIALLFTVERDSSEIRFCCDENISVSQWNLELVEDPYWDNYFLFFVSLIIAGVLFWKMDWKRPQYAYVLLMMAVFITLPFFGTPLMGSSIQDFRFHLSRIRGMGEAIASGQFPVRLNVDMSGGYGFASEIMYPNLFIYIPALLYLCGLSLMAAYKFFILFINIGTALIGYYSFSRLLRSEKAGAVCTFLYLVNPYRLNNIFLRGAIGEVLAQIFFPLLLYALVELLYRDYRKWWLLVVSVTGILQSHVLSLEYSALFSFVFIIGSWKCFKEKDGLKKLLAGIKAAVLIVVLNLWFLIPFVDHFGQEYYLLNDKRSLVKHAVYLPQMFFSFFDISGCDVANGLSGEMPLTIGIVLLFGSILFIYFAYGKKCIVNNKKTGSICLIFGIISCYMASELFPWKFLEQNLETVYEILAKIQYPWRMLGFAVLFLSIVTAIAVITLQEHGKKEIISVIILASAFLMLECMDGYLTDGEVIVSSRNQYIPAGVYEDYYRSDFIIDEWDTTMYEADHIMTQEEADIKITDYRKKGIYLEFSFSREDSSENTTLYLPLYNYYLHSAELNGQNIDIQTGINGRIAVTIPEGIDEGNLIVKYAGRTLYKLGDLISLVGAVGIVGYFIIKRKRNKQTAA